MNSRVQISSYERSKRMDPAQWQKRKAVQVGRIGIGLMVAGALGLLALALTGCGTFGTTPSAPTAAERLIFQPVTNYVPVVVPVTNYSQVVVTTTNYQQVTMPITNQVGVVVFVTNEVPVMVYRTNEVVAGISHATNLQESVTLQPKAGTVAAVQAGAGVLNTFFPGMGALAGQGVLALLGAWAFLRGSKLGNTTSALAQELETVREFIQALPNGAQYDQALVNFLQQHQQEAGVAQTVLNTLANDVSNPDAKVAAQQLANSINALQGVTTKLGPVSLT